MASRSSRQCDGGLRENCISPIVKPQREPFSSSDCESTPSVTPAGDVPRPMPVGAMGEAGGGGTTVMAKGVPPPPPLVEPPVQPGTGRHP